MGTPPRPSPQLLCRWVLQAHFSTKGHDGGHACHQLHNPAECQNYALCQKQKHCCCMHSFHDSPLLTCAHAARNNAACFLVAVAGVVHAGRKTPLFSSLRFPPANVYPCYKKHCRLFSGHGCAGWCSWFLALLSDSVEPLTVGIWSITPQTGHQFKGVKMIPPGLHFAHFGTGEGEKQVQ